MAICRMLIISTVIASNFLINIIGLFTGKVNITSKQNVENQEVILEMKKLIYTKSKAVIIENGAFTKCVKCVNVSSD